MILLLSDCPTPHHTPVYDRLYRELDGELCVFYLRDAPESPRGWGEVAVEHRYVLLRGVRGWLALARLLCSGRLQAVCVAGYRGPARVLSSLLARLRGIPLVLRGEANVRDELAHSRLRRFLKRRYLRAVLGQPEVWTNGSANTAYWQLLGLRRQYLIPYSLQQLPRGEDGAAALRVDLGLEGRFVFTFVGRLEPIKGISDLLQAYDAVRAATPPGSTALVIVGCGSLERSVRRYAEQHDEVHYLGAVPQDRLGSVYASADVFLVPSLREPWGWVVNEALGFGTRVIASGEVAAADDLCREETGRRCPASDPVGLTAAMLAEYEQGPRRAPRLKSEETAAAMADRLRRITRRRPHHGEAPRPLDRQPT